MSALETIAAAQLARASRKPGAMGTPRPVSIAPPWVDPPENFEGFDLTAAISTPPVGTGETLVLSYRVPRGFDGVVKGLVHNYIGGGFQQGAGGIVWRLSVDGQWVRHYDAMLVSFGSVQHPRPISGIRVCENQLIQYWVNVIGGDGLLYSAETQIICGISGWIYPRGGLL